LLGFDKLVTFILKEWLQDIKRNQLQGLLGGVGPMHALVQLCKSSLFSDSVVKKLLQRARQCCLDMQWIVLFAV
jgi:hypothetical protein